MRGKPFICLLAAGLAAGSEAVIVAGGDGTQNTTAPTGGQGWDYVGRITGSAPSSVTYLGNNWFITANHIKVLDNPTGVLLGASEYTIQNTSWTRLANDGGSDTDLMLFRVDQTVGLAPVALASSPANGAALTLIGNGRNRATGLTQWNVNTGVDPWTWTETGSGGNAAGYKWATGSTKRWGTNTKEGNAGLVDDGFGITDMFYTDFDGVVGEAQGATYDSGGGVFVQNGGTWELAGIMLTTGTFSGQPGGTAVFGNLTYIANLGTYADQINGIVAIPEPSALILGLLFPAAAWFIRRTFLL